MGLGLGARSWAASGTIELYFTKGVVTALEIPLKGCLIVKFVPGTTLVIRTDWFNLLGPSILALFIVVVDTVEVWLLIIRGGDGGENNEFLWLGYRYDQLTMEPYPRSGLDRREKLVLIEALLWRS